MNIIQRIRFKTNSVNILIQDTGHPSDSIDSTEEMTENDTQTESKKESESHPAKSGASASSSQADVKLAEDIEKAKTLPIPSMNNFWTIEPEGSTGFGKKGLFRFIKKKDLSEDEIGTLRQESEKAPGQARVKVHLLMKKYTTSPSLLSLSAYCTYRMVQNSSNRKTVIDGYASASKEAATALINDGISLANVENLFLIYFDYLGKLKRFQISTYRSVRESGKHIAAKKELATAIKICDSMLEEKNRAAKVLSQIKGKFKSSSYTSLWRFEHIQMATKKVEQSEYKVMCGPAEAREILVYSLALTELFARIPFLGPLVDKLLTMIPETSTSFFLRKSAIMVTRAFSLLNVAIQQGDMERMRSIGRQIYKTTIENMNRIADQPIKQSFEADPYFQLSRMAVLTFGTFEAKEQKQILQKALSAMRKVAKMDVTKNHVYTETAQSLAVKLENFLTDQ